MDMIILIHRYGEKRALEIARSSLDLMDLIINGKRKNGDKRKDLDGNRDPKN